MAWMSLGPWINRGILKRRSLWAQILGFFSKLSPSASSSCSNPHQTSSETWLVFIPKFWKSSVPNVNNLRVVLLKKYDKFRPSKLDKKNSASWSSPVGWLKKSRKTTSVNASQNDFYEIQFHIWCMNPSAVGLLSSTKLQKLPPNCWKNRFSQVFGDLAERTRSIILASGTLSPIDTFASELGCSFPVVLEASHVIKKSQVFITHYNYSISTTIKSWPWVSITQKKVVGLMLIYWTDNQVSWEAVSLNFVNRVMICCVWSCKHLEYLLSYLKFC